MTPTMHGRPSLGFIDRLLLSSLLLTPLLFIAACATPSGESASRSSSSASATPLEVNTGAAASGMGTASQAAAGPVSAETESATGPAPIPVDPLRPEVRLDPNDRAATQIDLWARVRRGFTMPELDTDLVRNREQWYASHADYVQRMTERGGRYLFYIVEELDKRGMPTELALLPFIESAYNPQAMSSARASGMWQFIPGTGRDYALKQNIFRDDRRDVLQSTRAALDYLQKLYAMFGDWHLALAAYNWGEGSVQRAIAKNQKAGLPTDYASLKMPNETQYYVPKLQAVKNIIARPTDFGLTLAPLRNHPYFLSVPIDRDMDVAVAIKLAGMPLDEFQHLNPQMNKPVILAAGTPQVLLPYDNANQFVRELPRHRGPLASWTAWIAPKTVHPAEAARDVGMSEAQLREVNRIPPRMLVKAGSTLLVPRGERRQADVSAQIADNATMALAPDAPPLRRVSLRAGRRENVASVAKRYRVSQAQVAQWNSVAADASFKPGQTVIVFVANKSKASKGSHVASTRGSRSVKAARGASRGAKPSATAAPRTATTKRKGRERLARNGA